jgi:hypothetical protein
VEIQEQERNLWTARSALWQKDILYIFQGVRKRITVERLWVEVIVLNSISAMRGRGGSGEGCIIQGIEFPNPLHWGGGRQV